MNNDFILQFVCMTADKSIYKKLIFVNLLIGFYHVGIDEVHLKLAVILIKLAKL